MRYSASILLLAAMLKLFGGEFDLFEEQNNLDPSIYRDIKYNKFRSSYSLFPVEQKKFGIGFSRYFSKKLGMHFEWDFTETGKDLKEKSEIILAGTYRFTKRAWTWVFSGDLGLSVSDDVTDLNGVSKGFRLNHLYGRFSAEYIFSNGLGFDYSMSARMTLETAVDEDVSPIHSIGLIYQF